jgi:hypothetical protein
VWKKTMEHSNNGDSQLVDHDDSRYIGSITYNDQKIEAKGPLHPKIISWSISNNHMTGYC